MATKVKKKLSFTLFKKHKKIAVILICLAVFLSSFAFINYSRYVKDVINIYYLRTKNFYFNSDFLTIGGNKKYKINPWVVGNTTDNNFTITINMNTRLNSLKTTKGDVIYNVTCEVLTTDVNIDCEIADKSTTSRSVTQERTIYGSETTDIGDKIHNQDSFNIILKPRNLDNLVNEKIVEVKVEAESQSPYKLKLSATFELVIGDYTIGYEIVDQSNQRYLDVIVTNSSQQYSYTPKLSINKSYGDGQGLVILDQSNSIIDAIKKYPGYNAGSNLYDENYITATDGVIDSIKINMPERSGARIRFYKKDPSADYSYKNNSYKYPEPGLDQGPVVKMTIVEP